MRRGPDPVPGHRLTPACPAPFPFDVECHVPPRGGRQGHRGGRWRGSGIRRRRHPPGSADASATIAQALSAGHDRAARPPRSPRASPGGDPAVDTRPS
ncbi:MAG: hypothetical protein ACK559_16885, partial [bacterium]